MVTDTEYSTKLLDVYPGLELEDVVCTNPGDHKKASHWRVVVTRDGYTHRLVVPDFSHGSAHRVWKYTRPYDMPYYVLDALGGAKPVRGERVPWSVLNAMGRLKYDHPDSQETIESFKKCTAPIPPDLETVVWCLTLDAETSTNNTLDEYAEEFCSGRPVSEILTSWLECQRVAAELPRLGLSLDRLIEIFQDF